MSNFCRFIKKFTSGCFFANHPFSRYFCFNHKTLYMQAGRHFYAFLYVLFFVGPVIGNAQFSKGSRITGASVASMVFNTGTSEQTVTSIGSQSGKISGYAISITPQLGWFVAENTAVGFTVNVNPFGEKISFEENGSTFQSDKTNSFNAGVGGFVRNYFIRSGSVLPFGQLSFDAGVSSRKTEGFYYGGTGPSAFKRSYTGKSSDGFYGNIFLTTGITKMISKMVGIDLYLGYNYAFNKINLETTTLTDDMIDGTIDETAKSMSKNKLTNHRFILGLGFQVFLSKK